jgi:1-acyl-sn-glycerol-3-phosphate acyltransferase
MNLALAARLLKILLRILQGLFICTVLFPWMGRRRRLGHIQRWSASVLRLFRVEVEVVAGSRARADGLWVANHISWLDIFVINAAFPSRFVAKSDVRQWPLIGALCAAAGTIFLNRSKPRALRSTMGTLVAALVDGERVVVFPEGTSAAQGGLLPFRTNLFEAAIEAQVPVQPLALSYRDDAARLHAAVEYTGDTSLSTSIVALLSGPPIHARLEILPVLEAGAADRRALARRAHEQVSGSLAQAMAGES